MARKIRWSRQAQQERREIFAYWNEHNSSFTYSGKLNRLFKEALEGLKTHPYIGRPTQAENVYIMLIKQFQVVYKVKSNIIEVLKIFDGRRNPEKFKYDI